MTGTAARTTTATGSTPAWSSRETTTEEASSSLGKVQRLGPLPESSALRAQVDTLSRQLHEDFAERFWELVSDWRTHNQPNCGVNWKCGQEISFRLMAWCFGLFELRHSPSCTPDRVARLGEMILESARRLEANIGYAMVPVEHAEPGTELTVAVPAGTARAEVVARPFVDPKKSIPKS